MRVLFFAILLLATPLRATEVVDVFAATVPVANEHTGENQAALQDAFRQMLVKATGQIGLAEAPLLVSAKSHLKDYIVQYGYDKQHLGLTYLNVTFDPASVKQLLSEAKIPFWGENRPVVLCWIVVDDGEPHILNAADDSAFVHQFLAQAARVGLPVLFPTMDLQDAENVSPLLIQSNDYAALKAASARYHADAFLVAKVSLSSNHYWNSIWHFYFGDDYRTWVEDDKSARQITADIVDRMLHEFTADFSSVGHETQSVILALEGVDSLPSLTHVLTYLSHLEGVGAVSVVSLAPERVLLQVQLMGGEQIFMNSLAIEHKMILLGAGEGEVDLVFSWQQS